MAWLPEVQSFDPVYQWETTDVNQAGNAGVMNTPLKALVNRTKYLLEAGSWSLRSAADVTAVKAIAANQRIAGGSVFVPGKGLYRYDAVSNATADDNRVLLPADSAGRWVLELPTLGWLATINTSANELVLGSRLNIQKDAAAGGETFIRLSKALADTFVIRNSVATVGNQLGIEFAYSPQHTSVDHWLQFTSGLGSVAISSGTASQSVMRWNATLLDPTWTAAGRKAFQLAITDSDGTRLVETIDKDGGITWLGKDSGSWTFGSSTRTFGNLNITNISGTAGIFAPWVRGTTASAGAAGLYLSGLSSGVDTGTVPMVVIDGRRSDNTAVTARDLVNITNAGTQRWRMLFSGTVYHQPAAALLQQWGISDVSLTNGAIYFSNNVGAPGAAAFEPVLGMQATAGRVNIIQAVTDDAASTPGAMIFRAFGPGSAALATKWPFEFKNGPNTLWYMTAAGNWLSNTANGAPSFTTRSTGAKVVLSASLSGSTVDSAVGAETGYTWFSTPQAIASNGFKWYGGTTNVAFLTGAGRLHLATQAETGAAETFFSVGLSGHVNSSFAINNITAADGRVGWRVQGIAGENAGDPGLTIKALGLDSGSTEVLTLQASTTEDGALGTRPILRIKNHTGTVMLMTASGSAAWYSLSSGASQTLSHTFSLPAAATDVNSGTMFTFTGPDAAGTNFEMGRIRTGWYANTATSPRGYISLLPASSGSAAETMRVTTKGVLIGTPSDTPDSSLQIDRATAGAWARMVYITANGDANSFLEVVNGSATAGNFSPTIRSRASGTNINYHIAQSATDSGTNAVMLYRAQTSAGGAFATRSPLFRWENDANFLMQLNNVGDLTLARAVIVGAGYGCYTSGAAQGLVLPNSDTQLRSTQHVTIQLDHNNNDTDALFRIRTNATTTDLWSVGETGNVIQTGSEQSSTRVVATNGVIASTATDRYIIWTGSTASSYTLPTPGATEYRQLTIKNGTNASGLFTVTGTVDGATNYVLGPYESVFLIWNGTDWSLM